MIRRESTSRVDVSAMRKALVDEPSDERKSLFGRLRLGRS